MSRRSTAYLLSDDQALLVSSIINQEDRLGLIEGGRPRDRPRSSKAFLSCKLLEPDKIALIDVTPISNSSFRHGYYLESPEFYDDFYLRIFDKSPNVNRRLYLLKFKNNTDYWVLRSANSCKRRNCNALYFTAYPLFLFHNGMLGDRPQHSNIINAMNRHISPKDYNRMYVYNTFGEPDKDGHGKGRCAHGSINIHDEPKKKDVFFNMHPQKQRYMHITITEQHRNRCQL